MSEVTNETVAVEVEGQVAERKSRKGRKNVTNAVFARVWTKYAILAKAGKCDKPIAEIAKELGLEESTVKQRSSSMRNPKNGAAPIALMKLPKGGGGRKSDANETAESLEALEAELRAELLGGESEGEDEAEGESVEVETTEEVAEETEAVAV